MTAEVYDYCLLFFACSMLGWMMEVCCKLIQFRRFINRGFLIGPYCPIYGFGAVLVTYLLSGFSQWPVAVFGLAVLVCGTLEYLTSYFMEKLFHARWWDYSQKKFNINGRVCADTLIPFGLLGLGLVYLVKPVFFRWLAPLPLETLQTLCIVLTSLLLADTITSTFVLGRIRKHTDLSGKDNTEAITKSVRETLAKDSLLVRRTLQAFPYAKLYNRQVIEEMKARRERVKTELKRAQKELHDEINAREMELKKAIKATKKK
ncbi:MAG: putative ABC transporter permease [Eubacteriales bacterium]|nr:putative ABC transporter permease [Eubacteriales bacterium]